MEKTNYSFIDGSTVITAAMLNKWQDNINGLIDHVQEGSTKIYIKGTTNNAAYGTVSVYGSEDKNCDTYAAELDEYVTIEAKPNEGYTFSAWSDGNTQKKRVILASQSVTKVYNAVFTSGMVNITASANNASYGSVSGGGSKEIGASVTLTATASQYYEFKCWKKGGTQVSTANPYTFNAGNTDEAYVAEFVASEIGDVDIEASITKDGDTISKLTITDMSAANANTIMCKINNGTESAWDGEDIEWTAANSLEARGKNTLTTKEGVSGIVKVAVDADLTKITVTPVADKDMTIDGVNVGKSKDLTLEAGTHTIVVDGKTATLTITA